MEVREDRRGCPVGIINFTCILGCARQGIKRMSFYEPFMAFKSPNNHELHVWLWVVEQKNLVAMIEMYKGFMKFEYNIFHSTYLPCKIEGMIAINEARG